MSDRREALVLLGSSHRTAPLEWREGLAVEGPRLAVLYRELHALDEVAECLILNTCNRLEIYGVGFGDRLSRLMADAFCRFQDVDPKELERFGYSKTSEQAVAHIFAVSAGLDSQMIGETEILGQVKDSYRFAVDQKTVGRFLHRVFQKGFQAAKWARNSTAIGRGQVSIGNVAVDLAARIFGDLRRSRVLVVGSGEVGRKTVKALVSRGVKAISVTNRTAAAAKQLADEIGGVAIPYDGWQGSLSEFDIAICSTAAPQTLLDRETVAGAIRQRLRRPLFLIDLAVPRDIDAEVAEVPNVFLYGLDDLATIAEENRRARESELVRCREVLQDRAEAVWRRLNGVGKG